MVIYVVRFCDSNSSVTNSSDGLRYCTINKVIKLIVDKISYTMSIIVM